MIPADREQPIVSCRNNETRETHLGRPTAVVEWELPNATDNNGGGVNVACLPPAGSNFTIGQTEVVCTAVDTSGNKESCGFNVTIIGMCYYVLLYSCISFNINIFRKPVMLLKIKPTKALYLSVQPASVKVDHALDGSATADCTTTLKINKRKGRSVGSDSLDHHHFV